MSSVLHRLPQRRIIQGSMRNTSFPWNRFRDFIDLATDRFGLLDEILKKSSLEKSLCYKVLSIAGNRHFFILPPDGEKSLSRRPAILVAHYDRAEGSPGANDNSVGVFMLIETAIRLGRRKRDGNWAVILTDKEELCSRESILNQGAYTLARSLKETGMNNARIFIFDACGVGDTIIVSTTAGHLLKKEIGSLRISAAVGELREECMKIARNMPMVTICLAPTPFSDDAGFLRAGFAAQTITVLPLKETTALISLMRKNPSFVEALVSSKEKEAFPRELIPQTWLNMNGPNDTYTKLTFENFSNVIRFAEALCFTP